MVTSLRTRKSCSFCLSTPFVVISGAIVHRNPRTSRVSIPETIVLTGLLGMFASTGRPCQGNQERGHKAFAQIYFHNFAASGACPRRATITTGSGRRNDVGHGVRQQCLSEQAGEWIVPVAAQIASARTSFLSVKRGV